MMRTPSMSSYFGQRNWESNEATEEEERIRGSSDQQKGQRSENDREEDTGTPAALHKQYSPSETQRLASDVPYHGEAAVDIIFVHGLGSKFETTWAHKRKDGGYYHWLEEQFPKDMPDARVLVYEYASRWYDDPVHTDLRECAAQFLRTLVRDRRHAHSNKLCTTRRTRPMILVGHSFGGLVIKQAMNMARQTGQSDSHNKHEVHRDILAAIAGVVFLGTPHRGSSFTWLASWKSWLGKSILRVQTNDEIVNILTPSSAILHWVQDDFEQTLSDERLANIQLVCYYEMREVMPLKRLVVEPESATLDKAASRGMNANHMEMNKFYCGDDGKKDNNYDHFLSDIQMIYLEAQKSIPKRFNLWIYGSAGPDEARERLQRVLNASREVQDTTYNRLLEIYRSAPYTCRWVHELTTFTAWKAGINDTKAIWIKGHGGSGKSVLAAYIIHCLKADGLDQESPLPPRPRTEWSTCTLSVSEAACSARRSSPTVLYFFCGVDRSSETTERMLGTLIHQLLLAWPENEAMFKIASGLVAATPSPRSLLEALAQMISMIGPLYIVIDNLEDMMLSKDDNPSIFLQWLSTLQSESNIHFLISGQETPHLAKSLSEHFHVRSPIDVTHYTAGDIQRFTEDRGDTLFQRKPVLREKRQTIMDSLHSRAHGSFQWVNSAFEHLQYVEDAQDVEPELDDIQGDLLDSYDKTFGRLGLGGSSRIQRRILLCLEFIAASATPVTSADVKIAWLIQELLDTEKPCDADFKSLFDKKHCEERIAVAESDIRNYVSSIVDICSDGTLQFKHPSYLKALTRGGAMPRDTDASKFKFPLEQAHRDLSHICMTVCRFTTFIHANSFAEWDVPLVQYAWNFWAYHLDKSKLNFSTVEEAAERKRQLKASLTEDPEWSASYALQTAFDQMIGGAVHDSLLYLEALMDFISRPLRAVPGHFSDREYVLALQRAQESLLQPAKDLCTLKKFQFDSPSSRLESQRQKTEKARTFPIAEISVAWLGREAIDKLSNTRTRILGENSAVGRLRVDEYLETNPSLPRPYGSPKLMIEAARNLRLVALRFAVDPIYSALLATAGGSSYSPLHPLVYLAQLFEESALYPYWESLSPGRDLMEPFICQDNDPEYASAKFVLHCFEWRDPRVDEKVMSPTATRHRRFYLRTANIAIDIRPCPNPAMGLTRVSTENFEQVRRLHQVKAEHIVAAQNTYSLFHVDNEFVRKHFVNPFAQLHMKYSLLIHDKNEPLVLRDDPFLTLSNHVPQEIQEAPLKEMMRIFPTIFNGYFVQYVVSVLESFGQIARQALATHFARIELALVELRQVAAFFWRVYDAGDLPPLRLWYFIPGLLLFVLRCRYFPSWGAYYWYHAWGQFSWAWNHPSGYVDMQKDFGFWRFCYQFTKFFVSSTIGNMALILTAQSPRPVSPLLEISFAYAIFNAFCTIDRSLFAICSALATLLACGKVMFSDAENIGNMLRFSLAFWLLSFVQLLLSAIRLGALEQGGGWKTLLLTTSVHFALIFLLLQYLIPIVNFFYALTKPARVVALWSFRVVLRASIVTAQLIGIALLFLVVFKVFLTVHNFLWDPYDVRKSLKTLLIAADNVHNTLIHGGARQYKRVGWYPLGQKVTEGDKTLVAAVRTELGPPRALPPLQTHLAEAQSTLNEAAGVVAEGIGGLLEGGSFQNRLDTAILVAGDHVGKVVDGVGQQVGRMVDGVGLHVGKTLADGSRQLKIQAREALEGHMKTD